MHKMHTLPDAFQFATYVGLWRPIDCRSRASYSLWSCLLFSFVTWFLIIQTGATLLYAKTVDEFAESTYMLLSTFNAFVKGASMISRRHRILDLADMLRDDVCLPHNLGEKTLCSSFDKIARYTFFSTTVFAEMTVCFLVVWPILLARHEHILPILMVWYPYDCTTDLAYWLSYLHQAASLILVATYDVVNDNIITGLMIQACSQLELMTLRLNRFSHELPMLKQSPEVSRILEKKIIKQSVRHHIHIFRFTDNINSVFGPAIGVQFCISSIVMCITIYQLVFKKTNYIELMFEVLYLISMVVEFFIYCWFGNQVTLKGLEFSDAISEMNWTSMNRKTIEELLIIMIRSTSPILLSCGPLITLSLDSFIKMAKLSFSAFNVLQRSKSVTDGTL